MKGPEQLNARDSLPAGVPETPPRVSGKSEITDPEKREQLVTYIAYNFMNEKGRIDWQRAFLENPTWRVALGATGEKNLQDRIYAYSHRLLLKLGVRSGKPPGHAAKESNGNGQPDLALCRAPAVQLAPTVPAKVILWPHHCWNCGAALVAPAGRVAHCCSQCGSSQTEIAQAINLKYAQESKR